MALEQHAVLRGLPAKELLSRRASPGELGHRKKRITSFLAPGSWDKGEALSVDRERCFKTITLLLIFDEESWHGTPSQQSTGHKKSIDFRIMKSIFERNKN